MEVKSRTPALDGALGATACKLCNNLGMAASLCRCYATVTQAEEYCLKKANESSLLLPTLQPCSVNHLAAALPSFAGMVGSSRSPE